MTEDFPTAPDRAVPGTSGFAELVVAATVGTGNRPVRPEVVPAPVRGHDLLDSAALYTLARRTQRGSLAETLPDTEDLAPSPDRPEPPPRAAALVRQLLGERRIALTTAVLARLDRLEFALPIALLPELATSALAPGSPLAAVLGSVAGSRGRWLLAAHPLWRRLVPATAEPVTDPADPRWTTGTTGERLAVLAATRAADPALGTKLVEAVWESARSEERAALLRTLADGLADRDTALVDRAAADRSPRVADEAGTLAIRLPHSRFGRRRIELLGAHVRRARSLRGRHRLIVTTLPAELDPGSQLDRFTVLVRTTALAAWADTVGVPATEAVRLQVDNEPGWPVPQLFLAAAVAQRDVPVLQAALAAVDHPWQAATSAVARLLPAADREEIASAALQSGQGLGYAIAFCVPPWSEALAAGALAWLAGHPDQPVETWLGTAIGLAPQPDRTPALRRIAENAPTETARRRALQAAAWYTLLRNLDHELRNP